MTISLDRFVHLDGLADELAAVADRVRRSVVIVRGPGGGAGSGVVWDDRGTIVTNHHVIPAGDRADLVTGAGRRIAARIRGRAADLDLAVLEAAGPLPDNLEPATIGDSTRVRPGEIVVAVGNPLGETNAVTFGIVGGLGRLDGFSGSREVIQAAITLRPGNSGGALADAHGRVIGVPHLVLRPNLAIAIPSHIVGRFLAATDRSDTAPDRLGITVRAVPLPAGLVAREALASPIGLLVLTLTPGSRGDRAGLVQGDLIVATRPPRTAGDWTDDLVEALHSPGVRLTVIRAGVRRTIEVLRAAA